MRPKTKTILFIISSFLLGILCGWFLEGRIFERAPFPKVKGHNEFVKYLSKRLDLDEMQVAQVDSILESRRNKMEVYKKCAIAMRDSTRMEIRKILSDKQAKLFDEFNKEKEREGLKIMGREAQKGE